MNTSRKFLELTRIREADGVAVDEKARTARVVIITEGLGNLRDRNYYTADAIASAVRTFEGKQFYLDHPSESEESDRPERSVRDLAGYFSDCQQGTVNDQETGETLAACFATLNFSEGDAGNLAFGQVRTAIGYQKRYPATKDVYCGISINGGGISHPGSIEDMQVNMVTEIQEAFSADVVTKPARGGKFLTLMAEADKTSALKRRWANQGRRRAQEGQGRVVMATVANGGNGAARAREAEGAEGGEGESRRTMTGARSKLLRLAAGLRSKLTTADGEGLDARTLLADIKADMDMLDAALGTLPEDTGDGAAPGEGEGTMLSATAAESRRDGGKGAGALETRTGTRTSDRTNEGDRRPRGRGAREAEDESRREGEERARAGEGERERTGEGEERARAGEGEERARAGEGEERARAGEGEERTGEGEGYTAEHDEGLPGDGMGGAEPGQRMNYKCAHCGEDNTVAPPRGYQMVASESVRGRESALVVRLRRQLEEKEARFDRTNRDKSSLIRENIRLRAQVMATERMKEATKLLKEANIPADIMSAEDLVLIENVAEWPVHIKSAQRMLTREGTLVNGGGNRPRSGGSGGGGDQTSDADRAITKFNEGYKKAQS